MPVDTVPVKSLDVVALGEAMVEFNQQPDGRHLAGFGGDTSNTAIAAARLGARTGYITQVGADLFGDQLIDLWHREGVSTEGVRRVPDADTGLYFVTHGAEGHRFAYRRAGSAASRMRPADLPVDQVARARWLHSSGISQAISPSACDTVFEAMAGARAAGTRLSYDLNFRPALWPGERALAVARQTLVHCDLFFPSIDEVAALTGWTSPEDIVRWSHDQGARCVALKLGAAGCLVSDAEGARRVAPHPVTPVDATGAGDGFAGALLARLAAGDGLDQAARFANVAAALSTLGHGAVAPLPRLAEVQAALHGRPA